MSNRRISRTVPLFILASCLLLSGCKTEFVVYQYPAWWTPGKVKSVAVLPFRCPAAPNTKGGEILSDMIASRLASSGTYHRVYNRNDLKALLDEHDLKLMMSKDPGAVVSKLHKVVDVQAVLVGSVISYAATTRNERKRTPIYGTNAAGQLIITGYNNYTLTRHDANVSSTASLLTANSGQSIYSLPAADGGKAWAQGSPPSQSAFGTLEAATRVAANRISEYFIVVRKMIEVDKSKALRTAKELYDGEWVWQKNFKVDDQKMYVVVSLPATADRNLFKIKIIRKGTRKDLAVRDVKWNKKYKGFGYDFSPKQLAAGGGGAGTYTAKFYSGQKPVLTCDFQLKK